uniref:uncharacterized protein LOC117260806 n=1 Tax=Epinephelus lanceolatus TaxID=310571 RepID=UPI0014451625|nr:uncharacterized protein LOC117260806 [Epinephelus lanceolatus]
MENSSQVAPHSAEDLSALEQPQHQRPVHMNPPLVTPIHSARREKIKWPKMPDNIVWMQLDDDLDGILEAISSGPVHKKVDSITTIVYNLAKERPGKPSTELNTKEPMWQEVQDIVRKAKSSAAPGPSGIPYKVYKKCPKLLRRLWKIMRKIWAKGTIPPSWKLAEGCFVPKEEGSSAISQFRTISLLNVECKIFFSALARRITSYMTQNHYINTSIQKGGIPGFSGCLEHTSMISQLIREAKQNRSDLTVVWLDLAYGSIPHDLIQEGLDHYYIPVAIQDMITTYLAGFKLRFTSALFTTSWPDLQLGKWFNVSLTDGANVAESVKQTEEWLKKTDTSLLPGKFKTWLYQHSLLPRLLWLFTVYEFPMTAVEAIERKTNKHIRRWLGIPPSFSSVGLYNLSGQLQLPLSSVVEEYKVAKCRVVLSLRDSNDDLVKQAGVTTRSGSKWATNATVEQAVCSLKLRDIICNQCVHRQGLGSVHFQSWGDANARTRRDMVQGEVHSREEEKRIARAVEQGSQGAWTKWDLPKRKVTWRELWRLESYHISFLLRAGERQEEASWHSLRESDHFP